MLPNQPLPLHSTWRSTDEYVQSLLRFVTSSDLFRNLCGGVHILDFLTRKPDLYSWVLPEEWRTWFDLISVDDLLDLLLREDLDQFSVLCDAGAESTKTWRGSLHPPESLVDYIYKIRIHSLTRSFQPVSEDIDTLPRHIGVGMKPKKMHEVMNFAAYVDRLSSYVSEQDSQEVSVIDFGSGQNYLGRTLACPPYNKNVIAIEKRHHNVEGARGMDVLARLTKKEKVMRNKKEYKRQLAMTSGIPTPPPETSEVPKVLDMSITDSVADLDSIGSNNHDLPVHPSRGSMAYIEHDLVDGSIENLLHPSSMHMSLPGTGTHSSKTSSSHSTRSSNLNSTESVVVSIHSCGNLTHHGLRSLTLNPSVRAVAMIGCCYNLLTERLGPPTYKHPQLRSNHPRLEATSSTYDPHGFPMSKTLEEFSYDVPQSTLYPRSASSSASGNTAQERGVRLNITARMMAVQAPYNWTPEESRAFFARHFYRALLQRILLDHDVVKQPSPTSSDAADIEVVGGSLTGKDEKGTPLIIGTLRKAAFTSFETYVQAALTKLWTSEEDGEMIKRKTQILLEDRTIIAGYAERFNYAQKHLAMIWSLMAFSAGVVESVIVVDRWLWLKEQDEVAEAWVQTVFGYEQSPRNLAVVGIKKRGKDHTGRPFD